MGKVADELRQSESSNAFTYRVDPAVVKAVEALETRIEALEKELAEQKAKNSGGLLCP